MSITNHHSYLLVYNYSHFSFLFLSDFIILPWARAYEVKEQQVACLILTFTVELKLMPMARAKQGKSWPRQLGNPTQEVAGFHKFSDFVVLNKDYQLYIYNLRL